VSAVSAVELTDLGAPAFPPEVAAVRAAMAEMAPACDLDPAAVCQAATARTGLDDFGDPAFRPRLDVLCEALRTEAGLSPQGVVSTHGQLVQLLANRLLVTALIGAHPEILEQEIRAPIIICGLPRTGTTHLHNLLAADPALRYLPYWESLEPVLPASEQPGPGEPDPRLARTEAGLEYLNAALPHFRRMHEMTTWHAHEEIQLLAVDVAGMYFETMAPMPTWRDHYRSSDQTEPYAYLRTMLQVLQWLRGGERWVLKSPQHLEQFRALVRTFPDATFVVTHRDPVSVTASMCTMITYSARLSLAEVDPPAIAGYWARRIEDLLRACTDDREILPADHSIDVRFSDLLADQEAVVREIYDLAGQELSDASLAAMHQFAEAHPRGRHGTVAYAMTPLGLDSTERRRSLAGYSERFGVADDWSGD